MHRFITTLAVSSLAVAGTAFAGGACCGSAGAPAARPRWPARPVPVQRRDAILTFAAVALAHAAVGLTILLVG